nr:MAG: helix-turn-helix domain protein [Bacteriophage sp.]
MGAVTDYALNRKGIGHCTVEHDMSQEQLAEMCGTSPVTFGRYLNGHYRLPLRVLFNMANAMKMDVSELVVKADE